MNSPERSRTQKTTYAACQSRSSRDSFHRPDQLARWSVSEREREDVVVQLDTDRVAMSTNRGG
jgi:hypothetical protein